MCYIEENFAVSGCSTAFIPRTEGEDTIGSNSNSYPCSMDVRVADTNIEGVFVALSHPLPWFFSIHSIQVKFDNFFSCKQFACPI